MSHRMLMDAKAAFPRPAATIQKKRIAGHAGSTSGKGPESGVFSVSRPDCPLVESEHRKCKRCITPRTWWSDTNGFIGSKFTANYKEKAIQRCCVNFKKKGNMGKKC